MLCVVSAPTHILSWDECGFWRWLLFSIKQLLVKEPLTQVNKGIKPRVNWLSSGVFWQQYSIQARPGGWFRRFGKPAQIIFMEKWILGHSMAAALLWSCERAWPFLRNGPLDPSSSAVPPAPPAEDENCCVWAWVPSYFLLPLSFPSLCTQNFVESFGSPILSQLHKGRRSKGTLVHALTSALKGKVALLEDRVFGVQTKGTRGRCDSGFS